MKLLPLVSGGNGASGVWFVFPLGESVVRAWVSAISGRERVFVDNSLVSERSRISRNSEHAFLHEGSAFKVLLDVESVMKGPLRCTLLRDGTVVQSLSALVPSPKANSPRGRRAAMLFSVIVGGAIGLGATSPEFLGGYGFLLILFLLVFAAAYMFVAVRKMAFVIEPSTDVSA